MISLVQLLHEVESNPKAIILAGAPGAGKGFVLKGLDLSGLKILNIDDIFIDKLKQANVSLDLKNATPEERSQAAKLMRQATAKLKDEDLPKAIASRESFILDGTAASYRQTEKLKEELENAGYEVFMLYVYTDLERSLKQNQDRFEKSGGKDRSLAPAIVMRTWKNVTDNIKPYFNLFEPNFVAVANTLEGQRIEDINKIIEKYLTPYKPTGTKEKTPAQIQKDKERKAKEQAEIQTMLDEDFIYDLLSYTMSRKEAQMRIAQFLR